MSPNTIASLIRSTFRASTRGHSIGPTTNSGVIVGFSSGSRPSAMAYCLGNNAANQTPPRMVQPTVAATTPFLSYNELGGLLEGSGVDQ